MQAQQAVPHTAEPKVDPEIATAERALLKQLAEILLDAYFDEADE